MVKKDKGVTWGDYCKRTNEKLSMNEFLGHCAAQGGNWASMLMTGIRDLSETDCRFKELFESMPDNKSYSFVEMVELIEPYVDTKGRKDNSERVMKDEKRELRKSFEKSWDK